MSFYLSVCVCVCVARATEGNWQTKHANNLFSHLFITCITHASIHLFTIHIIIFFSVAALNVWQIYILFCGFAICINQLEIVLRACEWWEQERESIVHISNYVYSIFSLFNLCKLFVSQSAAVSHTALSHSHSPSWLGSPRPLINCLWLLAVFSHSSHSFSLLLPALFLFTAKKGLSKKRTVF